MNDILETSKYVTKSKNRSIGEMLIDSGKLTLDAAEQIMQLQSKENLRFGDAAIKLGFLNQNDLQLVLASQFDYTYLIKGQSTISEDLIAAYQPFSKQVELLRALRSQLMLRCFTGDDNRRSLTIVSPERSEGRSYIAANLAVVF